MENDIDALSERIKLVTVHLQTLDALSGHPQLSRIYSELQRIHGNAVTVGEIDFEGMKTNHEISLAAESAGKFADGLDALAFVQMTIVANAYHIATLEPGEAIPERRAKLPTTVKDIRAILAKLLEKPASS
jgi:hypothetical protein